MDSIYLNEFSNLDDWLIDPDQLIQNMPDSMKSTTKYEVPPIENEK